MPNTTVPAATTGLPIANPSCAFPRFTQAEPLPGLASRLRLRTSTYDAAEQARAMNAILAELSAILRAGEASESLHNMHTFGGANV